MCRNIYYSEQIHKKSTIVLYISINGQFLSATGLCFFISIIITNWAAELHQPPATSGADKRIQQKEANIVSAAACTLAGFELEENHHEQAHVWKEPLRETKALRHPCMTREGISMTKPITGQYEFVHSSGVGLDYFTSRIDRLVLQPNGRFILTIQDRSRLAHAANSLASGQQVTATAPETQREGNYTHQDNEVSLFFDDGGFEPGKVIGNGEGVQLGPNLFNKVSDSSTLPPTQRLKKDMDDIAKGLKIASTLGGMAVKAVKTIQNTVQPTARTVSSADQAQPVQYTTSALPQSTATPAQPATPMQAPAPPTATSLPTPEPAGALFCDQCGARIRPGKRFCNNCGARIA
jgi:zinc-ribbon domain